MFENFRENVKNILSKNRLTYSKLSEKSDLAESTIKCFMCGANNSRRIAEKIADTLDCKMIYSNGIYEISEVNSEVNPTDLDNIGLKGG